MKAGWEVKPLGEVCEYARGLTYKKADEVEHSTNRVLRANNIDRDANVLDFSEIKYIREDFEIPSAKKVSEGSILICTASGSKSHLGKVALVDTDQDFAFGGFMGLITPKSDLFPKFLYYAMTSQSYLDFIDRSTDGANINNLKFSQLSDFTFPIPPLEEQKRIVAVLDAAFEGLTRAKENAETNLQNARELFESMAQAVFEIGEKQWLQATLPSVCSDFGRGKSKHRPRNEPSLYGGDYPFLQTGDLSQAGRTVSRFSQTYSEKGLAQSKLWPSGTICIAIVGATIGESAVTGMPACFPDSVIGMVPDPTKAQSAYVQHLLEHYKDDLKAAGEGSARDNINLATFKDWAFPMPSVEQQAAIVEKLNRANQIADSLAAQYKAKLQDIADLRQSLLQKAFAGELT